MESISAPLSLNVILTESHIIAYQTDYDADPQEIADYEHNHVMRKSLTGSWGVDLGQSNYTASKAGLIGMSKSLALEYAKKNININCISPGFIKTAMTDKIDEKFKEIIISKIPSARLGEPDDIANAVLFLASSDSDYINGETLHVNGGLYMA